VTREKYIRNLNSYMYSCSAHRWQELHIGFAMERGKQSCNGNRNDTSGKPARSKVEKCKIVADEIVVVKIACESKQERRISHNRF
jgi:hypothetical protein